MKKSLVPRLEMRMEQKQIQRLSQTQITALNYLAMGNETLRQEIYKAASENPAIEIVKETSFSDYGRGHFNSFESYSSGYGDSEKADRFQSILENQESYGESLQTHLLHQLNSMNLSKDEKILCRRLVYNLDKNGFYGSMISPESFLPRRNPQTERELLDHCLKLVQSLDPVGTCCRTPEESLLVQARLSERADPLSLFLLDGHLDFLNPPEPEKVCNKLLDFQKDWHKKAFASELVLDKIEITKEAVAAAIKFILSLNPHPAQGYITEASADRSQPDVVLIVTKEDGPAADDYSQGIVSGNSDFHFQIKYATGALPELRISPDFKMDKENVAKAQALINILKFCESTIVLQGCAIVHAQKRFFAKGPGNLSVLTRRQIAQELGIHESTVSRTTAKNGSKYIQTEWGLFPASYFFTSGVSNRDGTKTISSERIKQKMKEILELPGNENLSDRELCEQLNKKGAKIARRTVAKYRAQLGLKNSYHR